MNFSPFGGHFPTAIPAIHQFAAKFGHQENGNNGGTSLCSTSNQDTNNRYTANGVPTFTQHHPPLAQQQMLNPTKYQQPTNYMGQTLYGHQSKRTTTTTNYDNQEIVAQELCATMLHQQPDKTTTDKGKSDADDRRTSATPAQSSANQNAPPTPQQPTTAWQSLATPASTFTDYLSHLPASTIPLSIHRFLKYSAESMKKESVVPTNCTPPDTNLNLLHATNPLNTHGLGGGAPPPTVTPKKKKKKKAEKEKKPRPKPGEIRLTTALDGSTLYCCPECHMAYPEKELLEQHLVGHTLERRFVCDICGAGLKRKDHLTRHKQSHNPERPYVCTVCLKAFKRKEQLTLHFVIHSGEKRHVCSECGKGFYRKDHLRKHTRSHIARRVKAELSQQGAQNVQLGAVAAHGIIS